MGYFVYILYSQKDNKLYVGCTCNLEQRIKRHNKGQVIATRERRPFVLIYSEFFKDKGEAFRKERFLKSLWGSRLKRKILKDFLDRAKP